MAGKPIKISVLADTRDLTSGMSKAEGSLDDLARTAKQAGDGVERSLDGMGDGADTVASKGSQAAGALSGLGDLVGGKFGGAMVIGGTAMQGMADAGDLLNVAIEGGGKVMGKAVTAVKSLTQAETYAAGAKRVSAIAQRVLNAAMRANPIGIIITAIILLVGAITLLWRKNEGFREAVTAAWNKIKAVFSGVVTWIRDNVPPVWTRIKDAAAGAIGSYSAGGGGILGKLHGLVSTITGLPAAITRATSGMWDGIKEAFKSAVNWLIDKWNGLEFSIPAIDTHIPGIGKVGGFSLGTPDIPRLAKGGITTGPTLALIGDNPSGREAVIPLDEGGLFGNHYTIKVVAPVGSSAADIGRTLVGHIEAYERAGGRRRA